MMPKQKQEAEVLRHGLLAGVRTVADAVAWADSIVAADPKPDIAVIEVASVLDAGQPMSSRCCETYPGSATLSPLFGAPWQTSAPNLASEPALGLEIARWLYQLATSGELPEEQFGQEAYSLEDWFYLASSGTHGTSADALRNLDAYLERHAWRHEV